MGMKWSDVLQQCALAKMNMSKWGIIEQRMHFIFWHINEFSSMSSTSSVMDAVSAWMASTVQTFLHRGMTAIMQGAPSMPLNMQVEATRGALHSLCLLLYVAPVKACLCSGAYSRWFQKVVLDTSSGSKLIIARGCQLELGSTNWPLAMTNLPQCYWQVWWLWMLCESTDLHQDQGFTYSEGDTHEETLCP